MAQKDNHLSFEAKNKKPSIVERTEQAVERLKPEMRTEGQSIRDYIQNQGTHTGLIGAITGTVIAIVSFVADVVGSIARNLLWSQQMQEAIADRMRRTSPKKNAEPTQEQSNTKEDCKVELSKEDINIAAILKAYDIESSIIGQGVYLRGAEDKVLSFKECEDPEKIEEVLSVIQGHNLHTSFKAAMIAAAYQNKKGTFFDMIQHDIPTHQGNIHLQIKKIDDEFINIRMNENDVIKKIPKEILLRPDLFSTLKKDDNLLSYMENAAKEILGAERNLSQDLSFTIDQIQNITLKSGKDVVYTGKVDIEKFEKIFAEYSVNNIDPKTAAIALACAIGPQKMSEQCAHKNIFTNELYSEGHAHVSIEQNSIFLHTPQKRLIYRDIGDCVASIGSESTISKIISELQINREDAKRAKKLDFEESICVKTGEKEAFLINDKQQGLSLYIPDKMPDIIRKRALVPYLKEHLDQLPSLVEKDGKVYTALNDEAGNISYQSILIDEDMLVGVQDEIPRISPDEITPENFTDFAMRLQTIYEKATECEVIGKEEETSQPIFYYVNEEFDSEEQSESKRSEEDNQPQHAYEDIDKPFDDEPDGKMTYEDIEMPFEL